MNKGHKTIAILLSTVAGLLTLNLISGLVQTRPATAANVAEYSWAFSAPLPSLDQKETVKRLTTFTNDLDDQAKKGWRLKGLSSATSGGQSNDWTTLFAILER
jgi:hypothetical protein